MNIKYISPDFAVSDQIDPADVHRAASMGFRAIICNRPDGESAGQPHSEEIRRAAAEAGVEFRNIPVIPGRITPDDVAEFANALGDLQGDVLAYCRSGARAADLWSQAQDLLHARGAA